MKLVVFVIFLIVQVLDVISTILTLKKGAKEANPILRFLMRSFGKAWWCLKIALALSGGWLLLSVGVWGTWLLCMATCIYVAVVFNNFRLARRG